MTNEGVEALIDQLNSGIGSQRIFLSHISDNVDTAKVWTQEPIGGIAFESSSDFYFIRNSENLYIAAVFDMVNDLHVFVKKEHRKNGYLSQAMHQTILPHLLQKGRQEQSVSFKEPQIGMYINKCWGFEITGEKTAKKSLVMYKHVAEIVARKRLITRDEFNAISKNLDRSRLYMTMVAEQLESALGKGNDRGLYELARDIEYLGDDVLDFIEIYQDSPLMY